jgi:hypothetical protein
MKKLILPFLLVLFLVGCETESTDVDNQNLTLELNDLKKSPKVKVDICHITGNGSYQVINISENAVPAHLNHGDKVTYSPEGVYVVSYTSGNVYMHDWNIDFFDGANFTGTGGYPAGADTYVFPYNQVLVGTVVDGVITGTTTYENGDVWSFTGQVDQSSGIISLEYPWELIE